MRLIKRLLRVADRNSLEERVSYAQQHINHIPSQISGMSPLEILHGQKRKCILNEKPNSLMEKEERKAAVKKINRIRDQRLDRANKYRKDREFEIGDLVWVYRKNDIEQGTIIARTGKNEYSVEL